MSGWVLRRSLTMWVLICLTALAMPAIAGCGSASVSEVEPDEVGDEASEPDPVLMPDLVGMTILEAQATLWATGQDATVVFPSEEITVTQEAENVAGVFKPEHVSTHMFAARELRLKDAATEHYVVGEQSPPVGATLSTETSIELTAAPNWDPSSPWPVTGHIDAVKSEGAERCFECHEEDACSQCHVAVN